jgi:putative hydrolase of the HAD superfamily
MDDGALPGGAPPVLLCDYGEVLCLPPSEVDRAALAAAAELSVDELWARYWADRPAYDRGDLTTPAYWTLVLGREPDEATLRRLLEADISGWLHPAREVLAAAARAAGAGWRLAVLSNAPIDHAAVYDRQEWLAPFSPRLFSGRLGMVKPDPPIFEAATALLGVPADAVVFLDDRAANVAAARAAGMRAEVFEGPEQIDRIVAIAGQRGGAERRGSR